MMEYMIPLWRECLQREQLNFFMATPTQDTRLPAPERLATLEVYRERIYLRVLTELAPYFQEAVHSLADCIT